MSTTKEQEDLREVILFRIGKELAAKQGKDWVAEITFEEYIEGLKTLGNNERDMHEIAVTAMDEYGDEKMSQLLDYMVKHGVDCDAHSAAKSEGRFYWFDGKWITKAELIQNFL